MFFPHLRWLSQTNTEALLYLNRVLEPCRNQNTEAGLTPEEVSKAGSSRYVIKGQMGFTLPWSTQPWWDADRMLMQRFLQLQWTLDSVTQIHFNGKLALYQEPRLKGKLCCSPAQGSGHVWAQPRVSLGTRFQPPLDSDSFLGTKAALGMATLYWNPQFPFYFRWTWELPEW